MIMIMIIIVIGIVFNYYEHLCIFKVEGFCSEDGH